MTSPTGTVRTPYLRLTGARHNEPPPAVLVLEDGRTFAGTGFAAEGSAFGEAVFATGMTGYQETLTDPSYHRQIVAMTAPHIGNTGMNSHDAESDRIWVAGFVLRDPSPIASSWRAESSLEQALIEAGVVGVADVDTRALTRHLRSAGAMRAGVFAGDAATGHIDDLVAQVRASAGMAGANLTAEVTTAEAYTVAAIGQRQFTVVAVDLGIKSMTPHRLAERGIETHVVPADTTLEQILAMSPDGVFLSNGPGDPAAADRAVELVRGVLDAGLPLFGICFGNQLLGRALGLDTYKLTFGHRGINQPVASTATGKVEITAHNHGFAVAAPLEGTFDTPWGRAEVSHICLNDDVVEGLRLLDTPAFSVQYHPEAAAGPHDSAGLFSQFAELMARGPRKAVR
ncbi:MAG TPA: glutamine-hydrolyzing carbamoyl-phosphate synthase small subunit [Actinomycetota bacterium]|nr:glutamine-hydrolyzing carbamoyl-phosphate synthase small subunit [Actinomycetota bacterium]